MKCFLSQYPQCNDLTIEKFLLIHRFQLHGLQQRHFNLKAFAKTKKSNGITVLLLRYIYYQYRSSLITNSVHFIPVIGILEKNIRGKTIDTSSLKSNNFWFSNISGDVTDVDQLEKKKTNNVNSNYSFIEKGCKLE